MAVALQPRVTDGDRGGVLTVSNNVARRIVAPGLEAIGQIHNGEVSARAVSMLQTQSVIADVARRRKMTAPKRSAVFDGLCRDLSAALRGEGHLVLDEEVIAEAERWLILLRAQLGRSSKANLVALIDTMVLMAGAHSNEVAQSKGGECEQVGDE